MCQIHTHEHTHTPSWSDSRGSYGSKPQWVGPHNGSFVKMHCAPNTMQLSHKMLQEREDAAQREGIEVWSWLYRWEFAATYLGGYFVTGIYVFKELCTWICTFCVHTHTDTHSQTVPQGVRCLAGSPHSHQSAIPKFPFISVLSPMPYLTTCRKVQIITHTLKYNHSQSCHCLPPTVLAGIHAGLNMKKVYNLQFAVLDSTLFI